jgi:hypothetical protein
MSEVNYSKKQLSPLIAKYKIDEETSEVFKGIITMFEGQTNYQLWAIKLVYSGTCTFDTLKQIQAWADANQTMIQRLSKKNITSYTSKRDIGILFEEMEGLTMVSETKHVIDTFNTAQRKMMEAVLPKDGASALKSPLFKRWNGLLMKMNMLPQHKKDNLIRTSSALYDLDELFDHISVALKKSYVWNREDMLSYLSINASDCEVVFDKDNVVVVKVPSFASSEALCGGGRTGWCLTRGESYFRQYVTEPKHASQFFLFNFNLAEKDNLAHIGFTVQGGRGITNAHATNNNSMIGGIDYVDKNGNKSRIDIFKALRDFNVPSKVYISLEKLVNFKWDMEDILKMLEKNNEKYSIAYAKDNIIIINLLAADSYRKLLGHTYIDESFLSNTQEMKIYAVFNLAKEYDGENAAFVLRFKKDRYGIESLVDAKSSFGNRIEGLEVLGEVGLAISDFLNREQIDPKVMLHKLIDEKDEKAAVELIEKEGDKFDVNYEFENNVPVFCAIENKMFKLFDKIVKHKNFNCNTADIFGETLLHSLLYNYNIDEDATKEENENIKRAINSILDSDRFDFNVQDINLDTALIVASERNDLNWVVEKLVKNPKVDVNIVNDFQCGAFGTAIRRSNFEAAKLIGMRMDLIVRDEDKELAKEFGVNINDYINPRDLGVDFKKTVPDGSKRHVDKKFSDLSKIFALALSKVGV